MTPEAAQVYLAKHLSSWLLTLQPQVTHISVDETRLTMAVTQDIKRSGGEVSAAALSAFADAAMVLACSGNLGTPTPVRTVTLDTQFLRPAKGDTIRAEAEVTKAGPSTLFVNCALIVEPSGRAVALASGTFSRAAAS